MTNVCMKFEKAGPNQTLVIDRTGRQTDGQTDAKEYTPYFFEEGAWGIKIVFLSEIILSSYRSQNWDGSWHQSQVGKSHN